MIGVERGAVFLREVIIKLGVFICFGGIFMKSVLLRVMALTFTIFVIFSFSESLDELYKRYTYLVNKASEAVGEEKAELDEQIQEVLKKINGVTRGVSRVATESVRIQQKVSKYGKVGKKVGEFLGQVSVFAGNLTNILNNVQNVISQATLEVEDAIASVDVSSFGDVKNLANLILQSKLSEDIIGKIVDQLSSPRGKEILAKLPPSLKKRIEKSLKKEIRENYTSYIGIERPSFFKKLYLKVKEKLGKLTNEDKLILAKEAFDKGELDKAMKYLNELEKAGYDAPQLYYLKALIYEKQGRTEDSIIYLAKFIKYAITKKSAMVAAAIKDESLFDKLMEKLFAYKSKYDKYIKDPKLFKVAVQRFLKSGDKKSFRRLIAHLGNKNDIRKTWKYIAQMYNDFKAQVRSNQVPPQLKEEVNWAINNLRVLKYRVEKAVFYTEENVTKDRYVVFVLFDGLSWPLLKRLMREGRLPFLAKLVRNGMYSDNCLTVVPSMTGPGHIAFYMGVFNDRMGIPNLRYFDRTSKSLRNYIGLDMTTSNVDAYRYVPTIFRQLGYQAGVVGEMFAPGVKVFRNIPKVEFILAAAHTYKAFLIMDKVSLNVFKNLVKVGVAFHNLPHFIVLYLPGIDETSHNYGWGSKECIDHYTNIIELTAKTIYDLFNESGLWDKTIVIFSGDHGQQRSKEELPAHKFFEKFGLKGLNPSLTDDLKVKFMLDKYDVVQLPTGNACMNYYFKDPVTGKWDSIVMGKQLRNYPTPKGNTDLVKAVVDAYKDAIVCAVYKISPVKFGVVSYKGEAVIKVRWAFGKTLIKYEPITANVLEIPSEYCGRWMTDDSWLKASLRLKWPGAVEGIAHYMMNAYSPDLVLFANYRSFGWQHYKGNHGSVDPESMRVPMLIFGGAPEVKRGVKIKYCRTIDVYPTVCKLLGVTVPSGIDGRDIFKRPLEKATDFFATQEASVGDGLEATVVRVVDGDTLIVRLANGKEERVRLLGVDTPEKTQPMGQLAKKFTEDMVLGRRVVLEFEKNKRGRYGRLLAYVWIDGVLLNEELLRAGMAYLYVFTRKMKYYSRLVEAQKFAKENKLGVWGGDYEKPWEYRKRIRGAR